MAVQVQVDFETADADKALGEVQANAAKGFKDLGKIAEDSLKFEKIKAGLEGLKAFSESLGPIMGEAQQETAKTLDQMVKLGDAGFKIGSSFGPLGGLIGGVLGALAGYFIAAAQRAAELKKKVEEINKAAFDSRAKLSEMDDVKISTISAEIDKFRDKIFGVGKDAEAARNAVKNLLGIGATELLDSFNQATEGADALKTATLAILDPIQLTAEQAEKAMREANKLVVYTRGQIEEEAKELAANIKKGFNSEASLKSQEDLLNTLKKRLQEYAKAQLDAAGALRKALDQEINDEEDLRAKGAAAQEKRDAKQVAEWNKNRANKAKEDEKYTSAIIERENRWYAEAQAAIEWAETVKRVEYEVNLARLQANENIKVMRATEAAERQAELDKQKEQQLAAWQEMASAFEKALAPLGEITSAVFSTIATNIEKGNKAFLGVGAAAKQAISDVLKAFGKQWGAQALAELAAGLASLALGPVGGVSASAHFAASAGYGAAAAATGLGGAVVARSAAGGAAASASSPATPAPSSSGGNPFLGNSSRFNQGSTVIVQMNGNLFMGNGDDRALEEPGRILGKSLSVASAADRRLTS